MEYFSDIERGPTPRRDETISLSVWGGIVALIKVHIENGSFGFKYPDVCPDGNCTIGTNERNLSLVLKAQISNIEWPLVVQNTVRAIPAWAAGTDGGLDGEEKAGVPETPSILDLIQFCYDAVAKPKQLDYHPYHKHHHLSYDETSGKEEFRDTINNIFARNGIAYELCQDGAIKRLIPSIIKEQFSIEFKTGDSTLDNMLADAKRKFLNPKPELRKEAVERLWDCWERLKTLDNPKEGKKAASTKILLDKATSITEIRSLLEDEASGLTTIGNDFHIRHTETNKVEIKDGDINDYLFYRMFAMIQLLIKKR